MGSTHTQNDTQTQKTEQMMRVLYDFLMQEIEPDLTHEALPQLELLYEGETPEEKGKRRERYQNAFRTFADLWDTFVSECTQQIKQTQHVAMDVFRERTVEEEKEIMQSLDAELENL